MVIVIHRHVVLHDRVFSRDSGQAVCERLADNGIDADLVELFNPRMVPLGAAIEGGPYQEPRFNVVVPRAEAERVHQVLGW
jgi:dienelactone hydrolase